jgi:hypothetical protein
MRTTVFWPAQPSVGVVVKVAIGAGLAVAAAGLSGGFSDRPADLAGASSAGGLAPKRRNQPLPAITDRLGNEGVYLTK